MVCEPAFSHIVEKPALNGAWVSTKSILVSLARTACTKVQLSSNRDTV